MWYNKYAIEVYPIGRRGMVMKKKHLIIGFFVLFLLVALFILWRMFPHPFSALLSSYEDDFTGFSGVMHIAAVENGNPRMDAYQIRPSDNAEMMQELAALLESSKYRNDFRNLLPWDAASSSKNSNHDVRTVAFTFTGAQTDRISVIFQEGNVLIANGAGISIYHPTNPELLDKIEAYMKHYGEKAEEGAE